ncbi:MAG: CDP-alcohol phosphatidyltransferase family protein [Actinomycetota bacterium]|uniref:phosphatidylinositol phosphate synthase n=1 Tax=Candidatus Planktophila sp. TaxID=2175601 RepID=UPI002A00C2F6|nr:CDP-alcohol phosphatidyltransferase family protein [Actinomycetota bacterium]
MLSASLKPAVTRAINPIARGALRVGLTPNAVTFIGAIGLIISALYFYPRQEFFIGTLVITFFALSDLFDGAMARISAKGASKWGGFLDSTIDRVTDSAILIGLILALIDTADPLLSVALGALVAGTLVPYIRAKAESLGIECSGGIAERTERLIIALTAIGLEGLGVPYALAIGVWALFILAAVTVFQRIRIVKAAL